MNINTICLEKLKLQGEFVTTNIRKIIKTRDMERIKQADSWGRDEVPEYLNNFDNIQEMARHRKDLAVYCLLYLRIRCWLVIIYRIRRLCKKGKILKNIRENNKNRKF